MTIAVSAFFAGLAAGSTLLGRLADRSGRPMRLYAMLEAGVAVTGVGATYALGSSAPAFVRLEDTVGPAAWLLPFLLVGIPAALMGGTLPAAVRALGPADRVIGRTTGLLYAANTAGAIVGTLLVPFALVPAFGVRGAALSAAVLSLAAAGGALTLGRGITAPRPSVEPRADRPGREARLALTLYGLAGAVALGYEVVWVEMLVQFLSTRAFAFAVMLATYLGGLAIGSWLFAGMVDRSVHPWRLFGLLLSGAGVATLVSVAGIGPWVPDLQALAGAWALRASGLETVEMLARFVVAASIVMLVPTVLLGGAFPAAARLVAGAAHVARGVGAVFAINTAGGIVGTMATGFLLIPTLGLVGSIAALALAGAVVGAVALGRRETGRIAAGALVATVLVLALAVPRDTFGRLLASERGGALLFYSEDAAGTVGVLEQQAVGDAFRRLYIQGVSNSGDALTSLRYMRLQALLPLLIHDGEPRAALVVGLGTGITAGALLAYPGLETRVVSELLPGVVRAVGLFRGNYDVGSDPRIEIRVGDGRHELLRRRDRYDLITLEPPPPGAMGVVNLYSRDFYELCRDRLAPGGLMAQWWPLPTQNDEDSQSLVRSFLDAFPYATAWTTEVHEVLLVGSTSPIVIDGDRVARRYAAGTVASALAEVGIESPAALLATWMTDRGGLERFAATRPPVTDDRPVIEHAAWVRRGEIQRVLPRLTGVASDLPLAGSQELRARIDAERIELHAFYRAALHAYAGDPRASLRELAVVLERDPDNPYYRWVAAGGS